MPRKSSPLTLEFVLLGLLEKQPMHGYDLYKEINRLEGVGLVWRIKQSQLYALLERLEDEGLLQARVIPGANRPDRREFSLSADGQHQFETWRCSPVHHIRDIRQEFLARLYFALNRDAGTARVLIHAQKETCQAWVDVLNLQINQLEGQLYEQMVFRYRLAQACAALDWLDTCEGMI